MRSCVFSGGSDPSSVFVYRICLMASSYRPAMRWLWANDVCKSTACIGSSCLLESSAEVIPAIKRSWVGEYCVLRWFSDVILMASSGDRGMVFWGVGAGVDEDVGGVEIEVENALVVCRLDGVADLCEELDAMVHAQGVGFDMVHDGA